MLRPRMPATTPSACFAASSTQPAAQLPEKERRNLPMANSIIDRESIAIECPHCGHKTMKSLRWINANDQLVCGSCDALLTLESKEIVGNISKALKAVAKFRSQIAEVTK